MDDQVTDLRFDDTRAHARLLRDTYRTRRCPNVMRRGRTRTSWRHCRSTATGSALRTKQGSILDVATGRARRRGFSRASGALRIQHRWQLAPLSTSMTGSKPTNEARSGPGGSSMIRRLPRYHGGRVDNFAPTQRGAFQRARATADRAAGVSTRDRLPPTQIVRVLTCRLHHARAVACVAGCKNRAQRREIVPAPTLRGPGRSQSILRPQLEIRHRLIADANSSKSTERLRRATRGSR